MTTTTTTITAPSDRLPASALLTDTVVITRRNLIRTRRTPQTAIAAVTSPVLFLVLMRLVFAGAIHVPGLTYTDYLVPAMLIQNVIFGGLQSATGLALDVSAGLMDRFRSMPTPALSPLTGRSLSDLALQLLAAALAIAAGFAVGFRIHASALSCLLGVGLLILISLSMFWLFAALAISSRNPETIQSTTPVFFLFLFVSNAFIPVTTLPGWLQGFAANQPLSVFNNVIRALTQGPGAANALGHDTTYFVVTAIAWCAGIAVVFAAITLRLYRRM
jgi:ABC-2 type transport system permease protein/oleandomycin transport system permease protein